MAMHFPATLVKFPVGYTERRATFYLATEEYLAGRVGHGDYKTADGQAALLFTWLLSPTVVIGRNQVAENELDLKFCHEKGIDVVRRKSGGGAIYADRNNIMTSLVTEGGAVEPLFKEYSVTMADALKSMGAPAVVSGRNDVIVDPPPFTQGLARGKVCGNAFYHLASSNVIHGTVLYDTDFDMMMGALRPPVEKLERHGVESVRQRVALLKDYLAFGVNELKERIEETLTHNSFTLSTDDINEIEKIEKQY